MKPTRSMQFFNDKSLIKLIAIKFHSVYYLRNFEKLNACFFLNRRKPVTLSDVQKQEFKQHYDKSQLVFVRAGQLVALISYALYAISDHFVAPHSADTLILFRFGVICPVLCTFLLLTWYRPYAQLGQKVYAMQMTVMGYFHLVLLSFLSPEDPGFNSYYGGLILIICGLGTLGGLRTINSLIVAALILLGYQFVAIYCQDLLSTEATRAIYIIHNLFLLTATAISLFSSYLLETYSKNNYLKSEQLHLTVEALKRSEHRLRSTLKEQVEWSSLFTRFIRHELSNSVTGASTSIQLIARKSNDESSLVYVKRAEKCLRELRELLNKASEATSIEDAFHINDKEVIDIQDLLEELVSQYNEIDNDSVHLDSMGPLKVRGSFILLNQLFRNLLDNALRHSNPNSPVLVSIENGNTVIVRNEGDALPKDVEKLFELGQTCQAGKSGLFGLGLYVVKKIVLAHNAEVHAAPLDGQSGAEFTVRFQSE